MDICTSAVNHVVLVEGSEHRSIVVVLRCCCCSDPVVCGILVCDASRVLVDGANFPLGVSIESPASHVLYELQAAPSPKLIGSPRYFKQRCNSLGS